MTNGSSAKIGEVLTLPFSLPRDHTRLQDDPRYYNMRNYIWELLYERFAHHE